MLSEPLRSDFPAKSGGKAERSLLCEESRVSASCADRLEAHLFNMGQVPFPMWGQGAPDVGWFSLLFKDTAHP